MTIELVTGTPGSGKTTYVVSQRIAAEAKRDIKLSDEACDALRLDRGTVIQRRIVVSGIRGLTIEHERLPHMLTRDDVRSTEVDRWNSMQAGVEDQPVYRRLPGDDPLDCEAIVQNWWLWCKPGDLIVVDEAQWAAPRTTLGKKPPYWIAALATHRHYAVDFIFISQEPGLIEIAIRKLCGLHRHIRSVLGSAVCMVYTWDHASNVERYNLAVKSIWRRSRKDYRLFHSAIAHVAPPKSGRSILVLVPVLLVALTVGVWQFSGRFKPQKVEPIPLARAGALSPAAQAGMRQVRVSGCWSTGVRCSCIDGDGRPIFIERELCERSSAGFDGAVQWERRRDVPPPVTPLVRAGAAGASSPVAGAVGALGS